MLSLLVGKSCLSAPQRMVAHLIEKGREFRRIDASCFDFIRDPRRSVIVAYALPRGGALIGDFRSSGRSAYNIILSGRKALGYWLVPSVRGAATRHRSASLWTQYHHLAPRSRTQHTSYCPPCRTDMSGFGAGMYRVSLSPRWRYLSRTAPQMKRRRQ